VLRGALFSERLPGSVLVYPELIGIDHIDVQTFAFAASLDALDIRSDLHARFSLPYCVATLLIDKELHAESFLPDRLARPDVMALASRVRVTENATYSAALPDDRPSSLTVRTRDGNALTAAVRNARGNPSSALSREEVELKFRRNVGDLVSGEYVDAVVDGLLNEKLGAQDQPGPALTQPAADARPLAQSLADLIGGGSRFRRAGPAWRGGTGCREARTSRPA
jgi:MmgE/PrpD C-terminal domain